MKVTAATRPLSLLLFVFGYLINCNAQGRILVEDSITSTPIPFVSVYDLTEPGAGTIGGINGFIQLNAMKYGHQLRLTSVGYQTKVITYDTGITKIILVPLTEELEEVKIVSNDDPAIAVIKKVLARKREHSLEQYPFYQCRAYLKTYIAIDDESQGDSVILQKGKRKLVMPKLLTLHESVIEKQYEAPDKAYEKILHTSFAGLEKYQFAITTADLQNMDPFDEVIRTYGRDFINPLTNLSWLKYRLNLSRVYVEGFDSMYVIDFWPKAKATNTLKGFMVISGDEWAVQKIQFRNEGAEVYPFVIQKEYRQTSGRWFPVKMINEVRYPLPLPGFMDIPIVLNITATFDSVSYERKPLAASKANKTEFAGSNTLYDKNYLAHVRPDSLTNREKLTYATGGLMKDNSIYSYLLNNLESFIKLQIPVGVINIDLYNTYRTNAFDRQRVGLGLVTNRHLANWLELSGYINYATQPKVWNNGGGVRFFLNQVRSHDVGYNYATDLSYVEPFKFRNKFYNKYFNKLAQRIIAHEVRYHNNFNPFDIAITLAANEIKPLYNYTFKGNEGSDIFDERMIRLNARYLRGRQFNFLNTYYTIRDIDYPVIELNYTTTGKIAGKGDYTFHALDLHLNKYFRQNITGQSLLTVEGGKIFGDAPLYRLFAAPASRVNRFTLQVPNSFQTMRVEKYWSDQYIHFFASHLFDRFFNLPFSRPALTVAWGSGWGKLSKPALHSGISPLGYENGYHEAGIGLNNVLRLQIKKIIGLGINVSLWHQMFPPDHVISWKTSVLKLGFGFSY